MTWNNHDACASALTDVLGDIEAGHLADRRAHAPLLPQDWAPAVRRNAERAAAPPRRRTAAPPHRRTAAPPHRRTG
ncbi:hypothetical protein [Streptomyces sp. Je 1-369]|uniref:hypothetical protein n=1 Tax=Streptomyces sp. Je 1-369 TaxID=2966192 RepID=UPI002285E0F8|nr:hypothetical protein [Streptomyces sp. Je 1-369]WAL98788.1 hypothetical protein NOO62_32525 [Streptomyces sp. Je 1-369]